MMCYWNPTIYTLNMTRNRKRKAKRVIKIYKTIKVRKEVKIMEQPKKKFPWWELVRAVVAAVLGVLTGTTL